MDNKLFGYGIYDWVYGFPFFDKQSAEGGEPNIQ